MERNHPLTAFRKARGLTPAGLANLLEVSRPTIFRWESGEREIDEALLPRVTEKTGIPAKELRPDLAEKYERLFSPPDDAEPERQAS